MSLHFVYTVQCSQNKMQHQKFKHKNWWYVQMLEITMSCRYGRVACTFTWDKIFTSFSRDKTPLKVLLALMLIYEPLLRWCNTNCRLETKVYALLSPKLMFHTVSTVCMPKSTVCKEHCMHAKHQKKKKHTQEILRNHSPAVFITVVFMHHIGGSISTPPGQHVCRWYVKVLVFC